jgi:predicted DNA-binding protein (MmcQ/YjbR family)
MLDLTFNYCLSFPGVTAEEKWNEEMCFSVGEKLFCSMRVDPPYKLSFKCTPDQFHSLIARPDIVPMPYLARYHWVQVKHPANLDWNEAQAFIQQAYDLVVKMLPPEEREAILKTRV